MPGNLADDGKKGGCFAQNKRYLVVLNLIFLIIGAVIVGVAAWGQQRSEYLKTIIPPGGFDLAIAAGSILLAISIAGVVGTLSSFYKFGRVLLVIYNWILALLILLELIALGMLVTATGKLNDNSYANVLSSQIGGWVNNTYQLCCNSTAHVVNHNGSCFISSFLDNTDCISQEAFYSAFQDALSSKLVPVSVILVIAIILQMINIGVTYCVIRTAKKRYLKYMEEGGAEASSGYNHGDYDKRKKAAPREAPPSVRMQQARQLADQADHTEVQMAPIASDKGGKGGKKAAAAAVIQDVEAGGGDDEVDTAEIDAPAPPAKSATGSKRK